MAALARTGKIKDPWLIVIVGLFVLMWTVQELRDPGRERKPGPSPVRTGSQHTSTPARRMPSEKIRVEPGGALEEYLDGLRCFEMQMEAVVIDMYLHLRWLSDDKKGMKKAADRAVTDLSRLRKQFATITTPGGCEDITVAILDSFDRLEN